MSKLLLEKILEKARVKRKPLSIFAAHEKHHKKEKVDLTSFQAKRLGLIYLGFGRYGKIKDDNKGYQVTHVVKRGLLVPFHKDHIDPLKLDGHVKIKGETIGRFEDSEFKRNKNQHDEDFKTLLKNYVNETFSPVNRLLFSGVDVKHSSGPVKNTIQRFDDFFEDGDNQIDSDFSVYKGTHGNLKKGETYVFRGFMSTSLNHSTATSLASGNDTRKNLVSGKPTILQIDLKKGQKALNVNAILGDDHVFTNENEFILPRDTMIKVIDGPIYYDNDIEIWRAEVIEDDDDE